MPTDDQPDDASADLTTAGRPARADRRHPTRTKIVATLGPATSSPAQIRGLIRGGADVFRINFSHGDPEEHRATIRRIREGAEMEDAPIAVLADLSGPKIRIGALENGAPIELASGDALTIVADSSLVGRPGRVGCTYPSLADEVQVGERILIDDGNLELRATEIGDGEVTATVLYGGLLRPNKGMNLPGTDLRTPCLTEKDKRDLKVALEEDVEFVALSFVRSPQDVRDLRQQMKHLSYPPDIVAKIERPEAVDRFPEILAEADVIMIARGDMGVEMGPEEVPPIQKNIIRRCIEAGKPVITATQMLESMIENARPTRAEASDVANAIYDGTSALMLSGETAVGRHPLLTVRTMNRIARSTEDAILGGSTRAHPVRRRIHDRPDRTMDISQATVRAGAQAASLTGARGLIVFTDSGQTGRLVARERLPMRLFAFTPIEKTYRRLAIQWGLIPMRSPEAVNIDDLRLTAECQLLELGHVRPGDRLVFIAGQVQVSGATNTVHIVDAGPLDDD